MPTYPVKNIIDGQPCFKIPLQEILAECKLGGGLQVLEPAKYLSYQQIKWWKGILLPALFDATGDTVGTWETHLKLAVMPDVFAPQIVIVRKKEFTLIPSISILSTKKMGELMEGSVDHLHKREIYGDYFTWVTLPDSEKKKQ